MAGQSICREEMVRVQVLAPADGVRLVKRLAEGLRDAVRTDAAPPLLPDLADIREGGAPPEEPPLTRVSVYVPRSAMAKMTAYARILRDAARCGAVLPKFRSGLPGRATSTPAPVTPTPTTTNTLDAARIRAGMRSAREARNV